MGEPKEPPFFNLPPLPAQNAGPSGTTSGEKIKEKSGKSQEKLSKEGKAGSKEPIASIPTKPPPNLGAFKALIAVTWLLFIACVVGLIYVIIQYKIDRES
ncbi:unnamed protein product [Strongylus vulgaris]|uniref:Uncharacterized protein n=1 Tax=Strongylus vulgaris TaxID=40348 RepID=A0A3P7IZD4_STRVU|nr:unnamed protein product [Strongylus vulgaris]